MSMVWLNFFLFSCGNNNNREEHTLNNSIPARGGFESFVNDGVTEIKKFYEVDQTILKNSDSIVLASTTLLDGLKYLSPDFEMKIKKSNRSYNTFNLRHSSELGYYFECFVGTQQKKIYLILAKYSKSNAILLPLKEPSSNPLKSFFYFDYKTGQLLSFSFDNFWVLKGGDYSLNSLSTISFLNTDLYETYMMYLFKTKVKFTVAVSYNQNRERVDHIFIPDSLFGVERHRGEKSIYTINDNLSMDNLFRQNHLFEGIPITRQTKEMGKDKLPAWCWGNKVY
jgi:hypothetical protein